jgi:hypothetical protein
MTLLAKTGGGIHCIYYIGGLRPLPLLKSNQVCLLFVDFFLVVLWCILWFSFFCRSFGVLAPSQSPGILPGFFSFPPPLQLAPDVRIGDRESRSKPLGFECWDRARKSVNARGVGLTLKNRRGQCGYGGSVVTAGATRFVGG